MISIHALLAESDGIGLVFLWWGVRFLSTLSLRRATRRHRGNNRRPIHFYPRSPCGERLHSADCSCHNARPFLSTLSLRRATRLYWFSLITLPISIHALLAESDGKNWPKQSIHHKFLSTLSLRRATLDRAPPLTSWTISIHALLAESDANNRTAQQGRHDFYPRSPCGERRYWPCVLVVGRAISIHALLAESDETSSR